MGILDDAIREHLELKRRRGADPGEIERLEHEALGPVRRPGKEDREVPQGDEEAPKVSQPDDQPTELWSEASDGQDAADHGAEFRREAEDWGASDIADTVLEPDVAPPARPTPRPEGERGGRGLAHEDELTEQDTVERDPEDELSDGPEDGYPDSRRRVYREASDPGHPEPLERGDPAPPGRDHPQGPGQEDMLEETPEFLQDTPDHDRLWFEQRPPRDFDLDG